MEHPVNSLETAVWGEAALRKPSIHTHVVRKEAHVEAAFRVRASLEVPPGTDLDEARRLLERSEHGCLISNSLKAAPQLEAEVRVRG